MCSKCQPREARVEFSAIHPWCQVSFYVFSTVIKHQKTTKKVDPKFMESINFGICFLSNRMYNILHTVNCSSTTFARKKIRCTKNFVGWKTYLLMPNRINSRMWETSWAGECAFLKLSVTVLRCRRWAEKLQMTHGHGLMLSATDFVIFFRNKAGVLCNSNFFLFNLIEAVDIVKTLIET